MRIVHSLDVPSKGFAEEVPPTIVLSLLKAESNLEPTSLTIPHHLMNRLQLHFELFAK